MGNKLGRRRQVVDERYTKPQGLYVHKDVDIKKLKKLILESKLAPCYPGDEECCCDLEECPICFLYYPSLNRSRCCMKGICTECFLQMKNPNTTRPTQCPFCKTTNYAVEYRGMKTKEEKGIEQIEEQRVMEAKIRIRQQELLDEEERMQKRQELSSSSTSVAPREVECNAVAVSSSRSLEDGEIVSDSRATPIRQPSRLRTNGDDEFDLDLEDIMVMEAIWLSIQENDRPRNPDFDASEQYVIEDRHVPPTLAPVACSSSSPSGGLACAIAALAERQQMGGEPSSIINHRNVSAFSMLPDSGRLYNNRVDRDAENHPPALDSINSSPDRRAVAARDEGDWGVDRGSEVAEASTSYASSSDVTEDGGGNEIVGNLENVPGPIVPESFEEQMMLAMAVSLAEARSMTSGSGISWQ